MGVVLPFPSAAYGGQEARGQEARGQEARGQQQTGFTRFELNRLVDLYGRMVAAGQWKDYAIAFEPGAAAFWAFRRTSEHPEIRIEKRPALRGRQGMWALIGANGQVLRRGHELGPILAPLERRLMKLVAG